MGCGNSLPVLDHGGRVAVVTGGASGIGYHTSAHLLRCGYHVIVASRNEKKSVAAIERMRVETGNRHVDFMQLDLSSLRSVRKFVDAFIERELPLHLLILNAGVLDFAWHGPSQDGLDNAWATNHLGHFLLTVLLVDILHDSAPARIVTLSSSAHAHSPNPIQWEKIEHPAPEHYSSYRAGYRLYAQSKLCNVLFTRAMARRLAGSDVTVNAVHPGVIATGIFHRDFPGCINWAAGMVLKSEQEGAFNTLFVALSPSLDGVSGRYFGKDGVSTTPSKMAQDDDLADDVWWRTLQIIGMNETQLSPRIQQQQHGQRRGGRQHNRRGGARGPTILQEIDDKNARRKHRHTSAERHRRRSRSSSRSRGSRGSSRSRNGERRRSSSRSAGSRSSSKQGRHRASKAVALPPSPAALTAAAAASRKTGPVNA